MSLHVIIAFPDAACKGRPFPVYCGPSMAEAETAKAQHKHSAASFMEFRNAAGLRKNNPNFDPTAQPPPPAAAKLEIPADLKGLKKEELAAAAVAAGG